MPLGSVNIRASTQIDMSGNIETAEFQTYDSPITNVNTNIVLRNTGSLITFKSNVSAIDTLTIDGNALYAEGYTSDFLGDLLQGTHNVQGSVGQLNLSSQAILSGSGYVSYLKYKPNAEIRPDPVTSGGLTVEEIEAVSDLSVTFILINYYTYSRLALERTTSFPNTPPSLEIKVEGDSQVGMGNLFYIGKSFRLLPFVYQDSDGNPLQESSFLTSEDTSNTYQVSFETPPEPLTGEWFTLRRITPSPSVSMSASATKSQTSTRSPSLELSSEPSASTSVSNLIPSSSSLPNTVSPVSTLLPSTTIEPSSVVGAAPLPQSVSPSVSTTGRANIVGISSSPSPQRSSQASILPSRSKETKTLSPSLTNAILVCGNTQESCGVSEAEAIIPADAPSGVSIILGPVDTELILLSDTVNVISVIVDVNLEDASQNLGGEVEICLKSSDIQRNVDDLCLGFLDVKQFPPEWTCEDRCLTERGNLLCGSTDHFTNFALLLDIRDDDPCASTGDQKAIIWLSGIFVIAALVIILTSVVAIEIYIQVMKLKNNNEFNAITRNIQSHI